ncbi:hypothetical protein C8Q79DRAFT_521993 [Trametes meyenii]|nr:hypothetical protein C8Q79DRAFT_521993 [Trametes meyenii]
MYTRMFFYWISHQKNHIYTRTGGNKVSSQGTTLKEARDVKKRYAHVGASQLTSHSGWEKTATVIRLSHKQRTRPSEQAIHLRQETNMSISERLYIRWFPDEASEPTSTLVLTTPGRHFVDLRFTLPAPLSTLEWGIAGRSVGTPTQGKWIHEISSRTTHPEDESDEGTMSPDQTRPDVELERGRMAHPETGEPREYEEAWKAIPVLALPGDAPPDHRVSVWLELQRTKPGRRGTVVRVGQFCQGIVREGESISVQRWAWADGKWAQVGLVGDIAMPCELTFEPLPRRSVISHDNSDFVWEVKEVAYF